MSRPQATPGDRCWKCGAERMPGRSKCWLCWADLSEPITARAREKTVAVPAGYAQYGVSSVLLFIAFAAILSSIVKMHLGLGVIVAVLAIPALLRTMVVASRGDESDEPTSVGRTATSFLLVLVVVGTASTLVLGAFIAAFLATCAATGQSRNADVLTSLVASLAAGGVAAIVTAVLCGLVIWRLRQRRREW
jgi:hypothetical protein